ncbi:unnamed protein product [Gemmataceae bacterium]|nr:unnamed protein product [Gemmataceae bacterium]VTU01744.1 unnamed protein product [Gemmataceae bacterium]
MSITITDPQLLAQLRSAPDQVELKDPEGNVLGRLAVEASGSCRRASSPRSPTRSAQSGASTAPVGP